LQARKEERRLAEWTVFGGLCKENHPIKGEKPSSEAKKTPRVHRIGRPLGGEERERSTRTKRTVQCEL
jgi:hypothetical protein